MYNTLEMLSEIWYTYSDGTREKAYSYTYNWDGTLNVLTDHLNGKDTQYTYDNRGRLSSIGEKETSDTYYNAIYIAKYDAENRVTSQTNIITNSSTTYGASYLFATSYGYGEQGQLSSETLGYLGNGYIINYNYDGFNRLDNIKYDFGNFDYTKEYTYVSGDKTTSYLVGGYTSTVGNTSTEYSYTYDSKGNITKIVIGDKEIRYTYDDLGQLIREENGQVNQDFDYIYDNAGNIVQKKTTLKILNNSYQYVTRYRYSDSEWGDLLTSYDGTTITYDEIGNPLSYYNGSSYIFTWTGRQLTGAVKGSNTMSFTYNDEGIRTSKTIDGVKHTYHLNGSQIVAEEWGDKLLVYLYDAAGSPIGMMYRTASYAEGTWDTFWFEKNLHGDVIAVYDNSGTQLVKYIYGSAWGDHSTNYPNGGSTSPAQYNPFRYRGYYYDSDLGLYYLQSRYYDPNTCRFINADGYVSTGQGVLGNNMFAYCGNNPVNRVDPTGTFWKELWNIFTQTLRRASGYFAVAAGVSQADTPFPGPADIASGILLLGGLVVCFGIATYTTITAPSHTISIPKVEEKDEVLIAPPPSNGTTYYHVTTPDNAAAIMVTGVMTGSKWESGYVYAWKKNPSKYAIENSGAHMGVTISFKTNASFVMDTGITDPKVQMYGPVVSALPGPIVVWDLQIVG